MIKRLRDLKKAINPLGWDVEGQGGNNHYLLINKETGKTYRTSFSSSDRRSISNLVAQLKRINAS